MNETYVKSNYLTGFAFKMKHLRTTFLALAIFFVQFSFAQVNLSYEFTQSSAPYVPIVDGTQIIAPDSDDTDSAITNIGFDFVHDGVTYTQFVADANASIRLGAAGTLSQYTPLSGSNSSTGAIAVFGRDGRALGGVFTQLSGTAPNRVLTIEYTTFQLNWNVAGSSMNAQIKLYETTNAIVFHYGSSVATTTFTGQVGIRGSSTVASNFQNRTSTTDWSASTAGTASSSSMTISTTVLPAEGLIFKYQLAPPPVVPPTCADVFNPANSAVDVVKNPTLTWSGATGLPTSYDIYFGTSVNPPFVENVSSATTSYVPGLLLANTTYYWKVVPKNVNGDAIGCAVQSFTTGTGFNYCTAVPTSMDGSGITNVQIAGFNNPNVLSGVANSYQNFTSLDGPSLGLGTSNEITVTLQTGFTYNVNVFIDFNQDGTFDTVTEGFNIGLSTNSNPTSITNSIVVPLDAMMGQTTMRIVGTDGDTTYNPCYSGAWANVEDYTVTITEAPSCLGANTLTTSNVSSSAAGLFWIDPNETPAANYIIEYGEAGFELGTGTQITEGVTNPFGLQGLNPNTVYTFYVQTVCGEGDSGAWSGGASFQTLCENFDLPFSENFDSTPTGFSTSSDFVPDCWSFADTGAGSVYNYAFGSTSSAPNGFYMNNSSDNTGNYMLISPQVNNLGGALVVFNSKGGGSGYKIEVGTMSINNDLSTYSLVEVFDLTTANTEYSVTLPETTDGFLVFRHGLNGTFRTVYVDDISVQVPPVDPPSCADTYGIADMATDVFVNPELTWSGSTGFPDSYSIYFGTSEDPEFVESVSSLIESYTPGLLLSNTTYYWKIVPVSGNGPAEGCPVQSFTTGTDYLYCAAVPTSIDNNGLVNFEVGTFSNPNASSATYQDFTSLPGLSLGLGTTNEVTVTGSYAPGYGVRVFIDFNQDGEFDLITENFNIGEVTTTPSTGSITIPLDAMMGETRLRLVGTDFSANDPCYSGSWGNVEDYTVTITEAPSCLSPSGNTATVTSSSSADVSWTAAGDELEWIVEYGETGFELGTGETVTVTETSYSIVGLLANTNYSVYVYAVCSPEDTSSASGAASFFTGACIPAYSSGTNAGDLIANVEIAGTTLSNNSGTTAGTPSYVYFSGAPNLTAELAQGSTYTVSVSVGSFGNQNMAAWIDFNNNLVFELEERIGFTTTSIGSFGIANFEIVLPLDAPLGDFTLRIRDVYATSGNSIDPCINYGWGETEDYTITVVPAPPGTTIAAEDCGSTVDSPFYDYINIIPVENAQGYRVRLVNTTTTVAQFIEVTTGTQFRFQDIPGFAYTYGATYAVSVSTKLNEAYGPYGEACDITLSADPTSEMEAFCDTTIPNINSKIYFTFVPYATNYRYSVTNTSTNEETFVEVDRRFMYFSDMEEYEFGTTYSIKCQVQINGQYGSYGPACDLTTIDGVTSKLRTQFCGITLASKFSNVYADVVAGAVGFRFRVTNGLDQNVVERTDSRFDFSMIPSTSLLDGTTYSIDVAVQLNGIWGNYGEVCTVSTPAYAPAVTQLRTQYCNTTLTSISQNVYANNVSSATQYRFRVVNEASNLDVVVVRPDSRFSLAFASGVSASTTYSVTVAANVGGEWLPYGPACTLTTPALPTIQLRPQFCGINLPSLSSNFYAAFKSGAEEYRFKTMVNGEEVVVDRPDSRCFLTAFGAVETDVVYSIQVAYRFGTTWSPYGASCTLVVYAPVPVITLQAEYCGATLEPFDFFYAEVVENATAYRFLSVIDDVEYMYESETNEVDAFSFGFPFEEGTADIAVAAQVNGVWGQYGATCPVTFAYLSGKVSTVADVTTAVAYPNPFDSGFSLQFNTRSKSAIFVNVYDMTGKLVEKQTINDLNVVNNFGANFAAGVYNVHVSQDESTHVVRVVKK